MNEKNIPSDSSAYDDSDVVEKINDTKNNQAAKTQSSAAPDEQTQQQVQLENLIAEFNQAIIKTNFGDIKVEFYGQESPLTVNNFLNLAKIGFYNNTKFHRVMKDFMIQGGDPNSKDDDWSNDGTGGPGYSFQDEFNSHKLVRGSLAMANSGPNTNGSQFFIVTSEATPWLDNKHTNFGYVVEGMDIVEKIEAVEVNEQDHPIEDVVVESMELAK
ncbi:peptidylprolyl isomerase [Patescibacteria group bacterium]|nr:peptidylprolyl isomerase [Candidatus Falkowbacteria bacterium]MBU3905738.1 peptidylprolyl isomerase [Patescibacteria group bacterium]MBU4015806.1 peptidylprolyl isomerase [Patescibacteria group bacterium]MBU4026156.1 peptidylprolyl isomerase [Patescibacteria group bacterium]MBU4072835.1 peptidylprolyl isomerase [Patescibacteria group bacterium]